MNGWSREQTHTDDTNLSTVTQEPEYNDHLFVYTGQQPFIKLKQMLQFSPQQLQIQNVYYLDPQLSVIDISKKHQSKWQAMQQPAQVQDGGKVHYLITEEKGITLYQKWYQKYESVSDFIFGRALWGRTSNSLRIHSDMISRTHAKFICSSVRRIIQKTTLDDDLQRIKARAHWSHPIRKIPQQLWQNIFDYAISAAEYAIVDCGSRNHTFVIDQTRQVTRLKAGHTYQFETQDYTITVKEIKKGESQTIAHDLQQFEAWWQQQYQYNPKYQKIIVLPQGMELEQLQDNSCPIEAISFFVSYKRHSQHHFWVVNQSQPQSYPIGEQMTININYGEHDLNFHSHCHGQLKFNGKDWFLQSANPDYKVWQRLIDNTAYPLNPSRPYRFKLGHNFPFELTFHNFH